MGVRSFLFTAALMGGVVVSANAGSIGSISNPIGSFVLPISDSQTGPQCGTPGSKRDQYHMQLNEDLSTPKYHMGEDWNGECVGDADENYPLRAIADGKVVYIDNYDEYALLGIQGRGKQLYIRYSFPYAHGPNDVQSFDSAYVHINGVVSGVTWSSASGGSTVTKGQTVAYLGGTGGPWTAHLHWEAQWDDSLSVDENPYLNPLYKDRALKYRPPAMIVDDRRDILSYIVPASGSWHSFTMQGNAPSSTMYVLHNGQRKSLKNAIVAGWIPKEGIIHYSNGSWYYYYNVDYNFFENGKIYAVKTLISGPTHHIPVPRNNYQEDRSRLDMIHAVENDSRFVSVRTETYERNPNWDPSWELHKMSFNLTSGGTAWVNQATNKNNRLIRYTAYYDPDLKKWTNWVWVDWNRLY